MPDQPRSPAPHTDRAARLDRWQRRTRRPLLLLSLVFLVLLLVPVVHPRQSPGQRTVLWSCGAAVWGLFAADYAVRLHLSAERGRFVRTHIFDLLVVVLPMFGSLRALAAVQVLGTGVVLGKITRMGVRVRTVAWTAGTVFLVLWLGALAEWIAERHAPGASIVTFGDGLWWAVVTASSVGYGDLVPVTPAGRLVAVALMAAGITVLGVVTAALSSWLVQRTRGEDPALAQGRPAPDARRASEEETASQFHTLLAQVQELNFRLGRIEEHIRGRRSTAGGPAPDPPGAPGTSPGVTHPGPPDGNLDV